MWISMWTGSLDNNKEQELIKKQTKTKHNKTEQNKTQQQNQQNPKN